MIKYHIDRNSVKPVYIQLKDQLKEAIDDGRLPPLSPMPHVTTIAKEAGVSLRTADNALLDLIKDGICFRRPKKGTFVQEKNALIKRTVCGVFGNFDAAVSPLTTLLYCGVLESATRNCIMTMHFPNDLKEAESMIRRCDRGNEFDMKGIFFLDHDYENAFELATLFPDKKIFLLNHQFDNYKKLLPNMAAIVNDDFSGAYQLAQYVFSQTTVKNAVVLSVNLKNHNDTYTERIRGFRLAASENPVKLKQVPMPHNPARSSKENHIETAYQIVKQMLKQDEHPECIFCLNDLFAHGAWKAVKEADLLDKICITGYDCIHSYLLPNKMPTVQVLYTEMGKAGIEKLLAKETPMQTVIKLPPEVIKSPLFCKN
jgi:DNA-binding LacI/PurR family transcriptional regulator